MQVVPLGFNGPRFQKVFFHKRLTQITKLTSKNAINELSKYHWWSRGHKARGQGQEHKKKFEAKAKNSSSENRPSRGQGQECSRPRLKTKNTGGKCSTKKKVFKIFIRRSKNKKNKVFNHIFQPIARKS